MAEINIEEIKSKFETLQSKIQSLKEQKIGYESQLNTLQQQYNEQLQALLDETGASSLDEAIAICKKKQDDLNEQKEKLLSELDKYLATTSDSSISDSVDDKIGDLFQ